MYSDWIKVYKTVNELPIEKGLKMIDQLIEHRCALHASLDHEFYTFAKTKCHDKESKPDLRVISYYLPFFAGSDFVDLFRCHFDVLKELRDKLVNCYKNHPDVKTIMDCVYYYGV
jgi:hypothetical protein